MTVHTTVKHLVSKGRVSVPASVTNRRSETKYFYVFLAFVFIMPLWPNYLDLKPGGLPNIAPDRLLRVALFVGFIWIFFTNSAEVKVFKKRVRTHWVLTMLLFSFYLIRIMSSILSKQPFAQLENFFRGDFLVSLPIYFFALLAIKDEISIKKIFIALTVSGMFSSFIALYEFHQERNIFSNFIQINNDYTFGLLVDKTRDSVYRAQGTFEHPILLGQFFLLMLPIIWSLFRGSVNFNQRLYYILAAVLAFASIYVSGSRAAQILALIVIMLIGFWEIYAWTKSSRNRILQYLVILQLPVLMFCALAALYQYKNAALGSTRATMISSNARLDMFTGGIPKVFESPILGHGLGEAVSVFSFMGIGGIRTLDNYYLLLALDSGIFAPILFVIIILVGAPSPRQIFNFSDHQKSRKLMGCLLVLFCYIFELGIHSLPHQMWVILLIATCIIVSNEVPAKKIEPAS